jgi:hypothetical protein
MTAAAAIIASMTMYRFIIIIMLLWKKIIT